MKGKVYDIVIVGGGVLGIAHAYQALLRGMRVALCEKNAMPQDASIRNFGQVVPSGFGVEWQEYGRRSLKIYEKIQATTDLSIRRDGTAYLAGDAEEMTLLEELHAINKGNDYPSVLEGKTQTLARFPFAKADYVKGSLRFPEELSIDPRFGIHQLLRYCVDQLGLAYYARTHVREVLPKNGGVDLRASNGQLLQAEQVFICNGADFSSLYPALFAASNIQRVKIQMLRTLPQTSVQIRGNILTGWSIRRYESFAECPSYATIKAGEDAESFQRRHGVHLLAKQARDGSVVLGDSHHYQLIQEPAILDFDTDARVNDFIIRESQKIFALDNWTIGQTWLGYYSQCTDAPVFRHSIDDQIHIITAIGGKGMTASLGYAEAHFCTTSC